MAKRYRIDLFINVTQAEQAARQATRAHQQLRQSVAETGREAERAHGAVAEAASRAARAAGQAGAASAAQVKGAWTQAQGQIDNGFKVILADVRKLDAEFKKAGGGYYIPPGGGEDKQKYQNALNFVKKAMAEGKAIEMPNVSAGKGGAGFGDGRHRFAAMRDLGYAKIPVSVDPHAAAETAALIAAAARPETPAADAIRALRERKSQAPKAAGPPVERQIVEAYTRAASEGGRAYLEDIRSRLPHVPREVLDRKLLEMEVRGHAALYGLDDPRQITASRQSAVLRTPSGSERHIMYMGDQYTPAQVAGFYPDQGRAERGTPGRKAAADAMRRLLNERRAESEAVRAWEAERAQGGAGARPPRPPRAPAAAGGAGEPGPDDVQKAVEAAGMKSMVGLHKVQAESIKFKDQQIKAAQSVAQANEQAAEKSMIGLHKLQAEGAKFGDQQKKAAEESEAAWRKSVGKQQQDADKATEQQIRNAAGAAKQRDKDFAKHGVGLDQLRAAGMKAAADEEAAWRKSAEEQQRQNDKVTDQHIRNAAKTLRQRERQEETHLRWREQQYDKAFKREYDEQIRLAKEQQQQAEETAAALQGSIKNIGLGVATAAVGALVEQFRAVREQAFEAVQQVNRYRESLLELAAIKGQPGAAAREMAEDIAFRAATGQTRAESETFRKEMYGVAESSVITPEESAAGKPGMTREEYEKFAIEAGRFQAIRHEDPATHAKLAGTIIRSLPGQVTAKAANAELQRIYATFRPAVGSFPSLAKEYMEAQRYVTTGVLSREDVTMLIATFSGAYQGGIREAIDAFVRTTVGGKDRMRRGGIKGGIPIGPYLSGLGVKPGMTAPDIGKLVAADVRQQQAQAQAEGRPFDVYDYLKHRGHINIMDIGAQQTFIGEMESGRQQTLEKISRTVPDVEAERRRQAATLATEPVFEQRRLERAGEATDIRIAAREEPYFALQKAAFERIRARTVNQPWYNPAGIGVTGEYEQWGKGFGGWNPLFWAGHAQVREEMNKILQERAEATAAAAGMPSPEDVAPPPAEGLGAWFSMPDFSWLKDPLGVGRYGAATTEARATGESILQPGLDKLIEVGQQTVEEQAKTREVLLEILRRGGGGEAPGTPTPKHARAEWGGRGVGMSW